MTREQENDLLDSPWQPDEAALIGKSRPGLMRPDGSVSVTRRELRALASRYPTLFEDPPTPKTTRNLEEDVLRARYPTMYR